MMHAAHGFHVCSSNVHRVLLVTSLLSTKMLDDEAYTNTYWAAIGGVSLQHLNALEIFTLQALDFRLSVTADELDDVRAALLAF